MKLKYKITVRIKFNLVTLNSMAFEYKADFRHFQCWVVHKVLDHVH